MRAGIAEGTASQLPVSIAVEAGFMGGLDKSEEGSMVGGLRSSLAPKSKKKKSAGW